MRNFAFLGALALALSACGAAAPDPKSACDLPRDFTTWRGVDVRWHGIIVGEEWHGFGLIMEDCLHHGIQIADWPSDGSSQHFIDAMRERRFADAKSRSMTIIRANLSGKITEHGLLVAHINSFSFDTKSEHDFEKHLNAIGF